MANATATRSKSKARTRRPRREYIKYDFKRARALADKRKKGGAKVLPEAFLAPYIETLVFECGQLGWGPAQLAEHSGVSYGTAAKHLCGDIRKPQYETCLWLLHAVGCSLIMQ